MAYGKYLAYKRKYSGKRNVTYRKRPFQRKRRFVKKNYISTINIRPTGIPSQCFVKLPYEATGVYPAGAGLTIQQYQSSCFDPDKTGTGHQPRYFDQWAALYGKYQVLGMKATIRFVNNGGQVMYAGYQWNNYTNVPSSITDFSEGRYSHLTLVSTQGSRNDVTLKTYMSFKKLFGQKSVIQQDDTQALVTASPTELMFLNIATLVVDGITNISPVVMTKITYYVRMFDPLVPTQS